MNQTSGIPVTAARVREFLTTALGLQPEDVDDDAPLFSSGVLDSLSALDIVVFLEREVGTTIDRSELSLDDLETVPDIVELAARVAS